MKKMEINQKECVDYLDNAFLCRLMHLGFLDEQDLEIANQLYVDTKNYKRSEILINEGAETDSVFFC